MNSGAGAREPDARTAVLPTRMMAISEPLKPVILTSFVLLALAELASAQVARTVLGRVLDPDQRPVTMQLSWAPAPHRLAVTWLERASRPRPVRTGQSDRSGRFSVRSAIDDSPRGVLFGLATGTADAPALGICRRDVWVGSPTPLQLQPCGFLQLTDGRSGEIDVYSVDPSGSSTEVFLGTFSGRRIALPPGAYRVAAPSIGHATIFLQVQPGSIDTWDPRPPGEAEAASAAPSAQRRCAVEWTPQVASRVFAVVAGATGWVTYSTVAADESRPSTATVSLPTHTDGNRVVWIVLVPDDPRFAATARPVESDASIALQLKRSHTASLQVVGTAGTPTSGAELRVGRGPLRQTARTDHNGRAVFVSLSEGPHPCTITHPAFLATTVDVVGYGPDRPPIQQRVTLQTGQELSGTTVDSDRKPIGKVAVELRDPSGSLLDAPRYVVSDDNGEFRFAGLTSGAYTLFASTVRDGSTWSTRLTGAEPGIDQWILVLRNEDPSLDGNGKRR